LVNNNPVTIEEEVQGAAVPAPEELQQNTVILETSSNTADPTIGKTS